MCVTTTDMLCRTSVTKLLAWLIDLRCVHDRWLFIKLQGFGLLMHVCHHVSSWSDRTCHLAAGLRLTDPRWLHDRWFFIKAGFRTTEAQFSGSWPALPPGFARLAFGGVAAVAGGEGAPRVGEGVSFGLPPAGCVGRFRPAAWPRALVRAAYGSSGWCPAVSGSASRRHVRLLTGFGCSSAACLSASGGAGRGAAGLGCRRPSGAGSRRGAGSWRAVGLFAKVHAAAGLRLSDALGVRVTAL